MEEDLKILEDYSYALATISSATEQDIKISKAIEHLIQAYKEQKVELEKKDKIIDEMATEIFYKLADDHFKYGYSEEEVKQYFEKKMNGCE